MPITQLPRKSLRNIPTSGDPDVTNVISSEMAPTAHAHANLRLPAFFPANPATWFAQIEVTFGLHAIDKEEDRYSIVVNNLDSRYLDEVSDLLQATLPTTPYTTLKQELISRLSRSRDSEIRQLLSREEIGDRTPSQFLRHMRNLAKSEIPDTILRSLWEGRLPANVQGLLATLADTVPLNEVAKLADKVYETHNPKRVAAISASESNMSTRLDELNEKLNTFSAQLAALSMGSPRQARRRWPSRGRQRSPSHSRSRERSDSGLCWYHEEFGANAHRCRKPCNWQGNDNGSQH